MRRLPVRRLPVLSCLLRYFTYMLSLESPAVLLQTDTTGKNVNIVNEA